jgi:hypothetical protein
MHDGALHNLASALSQLLAAAAKSLDDRFI